MQLTYNGRRTTLQRGDVVSARYAKHLGKCFVTFWRQNKPLLKSSLIIPAATDEGVILVIGLIAACCRLKEKQIAPENVGEARFVFEK